MITSDPVRRQNVRYIILCLGLVTLAAGVRTLAAGEPEDGWIQAIRSGAVTSAWASAEGGRILATGLEVVQNAGAEGVLTNGTADGRDVMIVDAPDPKYTGPQFIYCNVPDWLRQVARVEFVVEYFDAGPGTIMVHYNSQESAFKAVKVPIVLAGTGRWRVARLAVFDAQFRKQANGKDFRIGTNRKNFFVRMIAVVPLGELDKVRAPAH